MGFRGVLVRLDEPSTKPPNGADGHRILVPRDVAKKRLSTLVGMGLNYAPDLQGHAQRRKVGVIKKAWIEGNDLCVEAVIWKHDFPEAERDLKKPGLGMSMELGKVQVQDLQAKVWTLTDFYFLGATILKKDAAAYYRTEAIAAQAERSEGVIKTKKKPVTKVVELNAEKIAEIAAAAAKAVGDTVLPTMARQTKILASIAARQEEMDLQLAARGSAVTEEEEELEIAANEHEEDHEEEACEDMTTKKVKAAKKHEDGDEEDDDEDEDDDEEMESAEDHGIDEGDLEEMGPETEEDEEDDDQPGKINKGAKNKGRTGNTDERLGKDINEPVTGAALRVLRRHVKDMQKQLNAMSQHNKLLTKELSKYKKQARKVSAEIGRRSAETNQFAVPAEINGMFAKAQVDLDAMRASGQRLSGTDVDAVIQASGLELDVTKRIEMKNKLRNAGLMDEGVVVRGVGR